MASREQPAQRPSDWQRRGLLAAGAVVVLVIAYFVVTSWLPRWWADIAGALAGKSFGWGVWWGLFAGMVFTVAPILVFRLALRAGLEWRVRGRRALGSLALAAPNLLTLGIVIGGSDGAHAGRHTLNVKAPGFTGGSLAGIVVGLAAGIAAHIFLTGHSRQRRELGRLRVEEKLRKATDD